MSWRLGQIDHAPVCDQNLCKIDHLLIIPHQVHQWAQQKVGYHAHATALHFLTCIGFFDMRRESGVWIAETVSRDVEAAAHAIGLQTHVMLARADEVIE